MTLLQTERLTVRRFRAGDGADLHRVLGDPEVVRFEPYDAFSRRECDAEAARRVADPSFWAVCLRDEGTVIGTVYLDRTPPEEWAAWELGFVLGARHQKQGYAAESCAAVIDHAVRDLRAHRITALCNPLNANSWRLLERLGFRREGELRQNVFFRRDQEGRPIWQDTYQYALLADEWLAR